MATMMLPFQLLLSTAITGFPVTPIDTPLRTHDELNGPGGIAWIDDDRLLVSETDTGTVRLLQEASSNPFPCESLDLPAGIDVSLDERVFIAEAGRHRILHMDLDGTNRRSIGSHGDGPGQLRLPLDVDVLGDRVVVADTGNDRVQVFSRNGKHVLTIGSRGTDPGRFRRPSSVAQFDDGRIAVADTDNHRVQVFTPEGVLLEHWGGRGSHPGLFVQPGGIEVTEGTIRVADHLNHRVQSFTPGGTFLHAWGMHALRPREGNGRIHYPSSIAVTPNGGHMAVAEMFEERVQIFGTHDPDRVDDTPAVPSRGGVQSHFGRVVDLDNRILLVWEPESQVVLVFDHSQSTPIRLTSIWSTGNEPESFGNLVAMDWDHQAQQLHMLDAATGRIHAWKLDLPPADSPRFDPDMARLLSARSLPEDIQPAGTIDAVRATDDTWFILDANDDVIHVLDDTLDRLGTWTLEEEHPVALAFEPAGDTVLVLGKKTVSRIDREGKTLHTFTIGGAERPAGISVGPDASIYVTDSGTHAVFRYDLEGKLLASWGKRGIDHGELWRPAGIGVDATGNVFVLDHGNHRCQVFTPEGTWRMSFGAGRAYTPRTLPRNHPLKATHTP